MSYHSSNHDYDSDIPWEKGKIFEVNGVPSIMILASKLIPVSMIKHGKVKVRDLRKVTDVIGRCLIENPNITKTLFSENHQNRQIK